MKLLTETHSTYRNLIKQFGYDDLPFNRDNIRKIRIICDKKGILRILDIFKFNGIIETHDGNEPAFIGWCSYKKITEEELLFILTERLIQIL